MSLCCPFDIYESDNHSQFHATSISRNTVVDRDIFSLVSVLASEPTRYSSVSKQGIGGGSESEGNPMGGTLFWPAVDVVEIQKLTKFVGVEAFSSPTKLSSQGGDF